MVLEHNARPESFMYQVSQALVWADQQLRLGKST